RDITRFACPVDLIEAPFTDIGGSPHEVAIVCLATYGITQGTSETSYSPNQFVRRGQMARFLFRLLEDQGVPMDVSDRGFTDIEGHTHEEAINGIASVGVTQGRTATKFAPNDLITRAEMATFLVRVADLFGPPMPVGQDAFDDDAGNQHEPSINAVAAAGIAQGTGAGRFDPNGGVTRAAMASFITRLLDWGIEAFSMSSFADARQATAALVPGEVVGGGTAGASGFVILGSIGMDDVLCVRLEADDLGATATAAHLHKADVGVSVTEVALSLTPPTERDADFPTSDVGTGRCTEVAPALLADLDANPEAYYVDIHTGAGAPAVRGQLGDERSVLAADLDGTKEVPGPGDADGFGIAVVDTTTQPDDLCYAVIVERIATPTAAHIHRGGSGVAGPVLLPLKAPTPTPLPDVYIAGGCIGGLDAALVNEIDGNPGGFYVNVHNGDFPDGAVRGQLSELGSAVAAGMSSQR
ncbi:MAG: CHRD domain-containing protein, partial [Actinomycetota bacterium]